MMGFDAKRPCCNLDKRSAVGGNRTGAAAASPAQYLVGAAVHCGRIPYRRARGGKSGLMHLPQNSLGILQIAGGSVYAGSRPQAFCSLRWMVSPTA